MSELKEFMAGSWTPRAARWALLRLKPLLKSLLEPLSWEEVEAELQKLGAAWSWSPFLVLISSSLHAWQADFRLSHL